METFWLVFYGTLGYIAAGVGLVLALLGLLLLGAFAYGLISVLTKR